MSRDTIELRLSYHDAAGVQRGGRTAAFLDLASAMKALEGFRTLAGADPGPVHILDEAAGETVEVEGRAALYVNGRHVPVDAGDVKFGALRDALAEVPR